MVKQLPNFAALLPQAVGDIPLLSLGGDVEENWRELEGSLRSTWSLLKAVWSVSKPSCSQASSSSLTSEKSNKILCNKSLRPTCRCSPGPCSCSRRKERSVQLSCRSPSAKHAPECTGSHNIHESAENEKQTNLDEPSEWSQPSSRPNHYHGCLETKLKVKVENLFPHLSSVGQPEL